MADLNDKRIDQLPLKATPTANDLLVVEDVITQQFYKTTAGGVIATGVADQLAMKADVTYVDAQNTAQNTVIGTKAATTYVDSQNALNEKLANKATDLTSPDNTKYPTTLAVSNAVAAATIPDATTTVKGKVKLANDLGGTADLPTTPTSVHLAGTETITGPKTVTSRTRFQANNTDFGTGAGATGTYVSIGNQGTNNSWFDSNGSSTTDVSHNYRTKGAGTHNFLVGEVRVAADPTVPLAVATKQYVDNAPVKSRTVTATVAPTSGDYPVSSYANFHTAVNTAINAVNAAGGGEVRILKGNYTVTGQIVPKSNVRIIGEGVDATILTGGVSSGYTFAVTGTGGINSAAIENLTIDTNNVGSARGIRMEYATNIVLRNLHIKNTNGWMIAFSTTDGLDTAYRNSDILIDNVFLDSKTGSIGALLFNNAQRIRLTNSNIYNISGPGIELYQHLTDIRIFNTIIRNDSGAGAYYSLTTDNITFANCTFLGGQLQGANQSDNGAFGQVRAKNIRVDSCYFSGNSTGAQIGGVDGMVIINSVFENCKDGGLYINAGNSPVNAVPINWRVIGCTFKNNNQNNTLHSIHPAIYFQNVGGSQYGSITSSTFSDDQATKTQRYPIVFDGAFTWDNINIMNNRLTADTINSGTSVRLQGSALLGSSVIITNNQDYSGTNPAQAMTTVIDATTTNKGIVQLAGDLAGTAANPTVPGLTLRKSIMTQQATQTANFTAAANNFYPVNASAGNVTVTLPTSVAGQEIQLKKLDANAATGAGSGIVFMSGTINGNAGANIPLRKINQGKQLLADGSGGWSLVLGDLDITSLQATTTEPGTVQLAGDLAGTAAAPTVPGLVAKITRSIVPITAITTGLAAASTDYVYYWIGSTAYTYTQPTAVGNTNEYRLMNKSTVAQTVNFTGGQNADGSTTLILQPGVSLDLDSNNSNWMIG